MINLEHLRHYLEQKNHFADSALYRLLHGRGQAFAGLEEINIDILGDYVVLDVYGEAEITGAMQLLQEFFPAKRVVWHRRQKGESIWSLTEAVELIVAEGELSFHIKLGKSQNCGLFLDMAAVRQQMVQGFLDCDKKYALTGEWLNLFSYTGSLSLALLKGGVKRVLNVDTKRPFLDWSNANHQLNKLEARSFMHLKRDALDFKPQDGLRYDGIICDPPQRQKESFNPEKDYPKLLRRMSGFLKPSGLLLLTHNDTMVKKEQVLRLCQIHAPSLQWLCDLPLAKNFLWKDSAWAPTFMLMRYQGA
jgi:23S rRNA (cytosine1962-C5)-methyltransferase